MVFIGAVYTALVQCCIDKFQTELRYSFLFCNQIDENFNNDKLNNITRLGQNNTRMVE